MKKATNEIENNRKKYTCMEGANYKFRSKNAIFISTTNKLNHELAKFVGAYMIKKYGDVKFDNVLTRELELVEDSVKRIMKDFPKNPMNFITEAVPKLKTLKEKGSVDKNRRIDLVRLEDEEWFEWENNHKIKKEGAITIYI